jgi:exosortase/archaeosortase family protein
LLYLTFYYGSQAYIGITAKGGNYYAPWLDNYFNVTDWLRTFILQSARIFLQILGYSAQVAGKYSLQFPDKTSVTMVYSCLGYGVLSFWSAFILSGEGRWKIKGFFLFAGIFLILVINILRVSFILLAVSHHWVNFSQIDHHFLFNCISYLVIIGMCGFYLRAVK